MATVLIGYRGSGKTTIGRRLADRLWQPFVDIDEQIVTKAGKTIREIFEQEGEAAFRELEEQAIQETLSSKDDRVVSLGGGAVLRDANRAIIGSGAHKVIYLKCEPKALHERIHADPNTAANRPSLTHLGGGIAEIEGLLAEREPLYRALMTSELDVTYLTPEDAVVYIVRML
jgi:shikimate kinase